MAEGRVINASELETPPTLSDDVIEQLKKGQRSQSVEVKLSDKTISVHYEDIQPVCSTPCSTPTHSVLFLHSGVFTSAVWLDTLTVYHLASMGYRAVAIDLPGKGQSPGPLEEQYWDHFLSAVISSLNLTNVVVVSPSSGGKYAIPFLFKDCEPSKCCERAAGFVPIAPHKTADYKDKYTGNQLPTLIVYGTKDPKGVETLADLQGLHNHTVAAIQDAGHPCYREKTDDFHKVLFKCLKELPKCE